MNTPDDQLTRILRMVDNLDRIVKTETVIAQLRGIQLTMQTLREELATIEDTLQGITDEINDHGLPS